MIGYSVMRAALPASLVLSLLVTPAMAEQVSREQDIVDLRLGQRILVDDGSCPAGQIKEVSGAPDDRSGNLRARAMRAAAGDERDSWDEFAKQRSALPAAVFVDQSRARPRCVPAPKVSLPTLAFFATAVITITSLSSGSTKIDWP